MKVKATGMARAIDPLGRVVIPKEIRRSLDWDAGDPLSIYVEGDSVILRKESTVCTFCQEPDVVAQQNGKYVCAACLEALKNQ